MATRDAFVLVVDVGDSMKLSHDGETSRFDLTKKLLWKFVQQKIVLSTGKKLHRFGVVIFNSNNTSNALNDDDPNQYPHIEVLYDLNGGGAKLEHLEAVENLKIQKGKADPIDAVVVASHLFGSVTKSYVKRIFMISDFSGTINDTDQFDEIAEGLNEAGIELTCIGIGFKPESEDGDEEMEEDGSRTELQRSNEKLIRELVNKVAKGATFTVEQSYKDVHELRARTVNTRAKKMTMEFCSEETGLNISVWSRTKVATLPGLKKRSKLGEESRKVKQERLYKNKKRDVDEIIDKDDKIRAYKYGQALIPVDGPTYEKMKWASDDISMKVIGFVSEDDVPQSSFMGTSEFITANPGDDHGQLALSALIRACIETKRYGLVRFVKTKRSSPKVCVLVPRLKESMECFIMNEVPFMEDIRQFSFNSFEDVKVEAEQLEAARALVRSLDLMTAGKDEDGDACEALKPVNTYNPVILRTWDNITQRALDPSSTIQPFSEDIQKYINPDEEFFMKNKAVLDRFSNCFNLTKNEVKKQGNKRKRADELESFFDLLNNDPKRSKKEEEDDEVDFGDIQLDNIGEEEVKSIGTTDPVGDFKAMMKNKNDPDQFSKVHEMMWETISKLVKESHQGDRFGMALDSIKHVRAESISEEEPRAFNSKFKKFRVDHKEDFPDMWKLIVNSEVTLIHQDDFASGEAPIDLDVTKESAALFLQDDAPVPISIPEPEEEDEDDALFDDLL